MCVAALEGGRIVSGSKDNTLIIWDASDGRRVRQLGLLRTAVLEQPRQVRRQRASQTSRGAPAGPVPSYPGQVRLENIT